MSVGPQTHSSPGSRVCHQHIILEQAQGLLGAAPPQQGSRTEPSGQPWGRAVIRTAGPAEGGIVAPGCTPSPTFRGLRDNDRRITSKKKKKSSMDSNPPCVWLGKSLSLSEPQSSYLPIFPSLPFPIFPEHKGNHLISYIIGLR